MRAWFFTVDAPDVSTGTVAPGGVMTATFTVPEGTTAFRCTFHPGMDGQISASWRPGPRALPAIWKTVASHLACAPPENA